MNQRLKRRVSGVLAAVMILSSLSTPITAFAEGLDGSPESSATSIVSNEAEIVDDVDILADGDDTVVVESPVMEDVEDTSDSVEDDNQTVDEAPADDSAAEQTPEADDSLPAEGTATEDETTSEPVDTTDTSELDDENADVPTDTEPADEAEEVDEELDDDSETDVIAEVFEYLEVVEQSDGFDSVAGDEVDFFVKLNRDDVNVKYQWQMLNLMADVNVITEPIYDYGEDESHDYYWPLEDVTPAEVLAENPGATWPGCEIYFDQAAKLMGVQSMYALTSDAETTAWPDIEIENGTHNYVLDGEEETSISTFGLLDGELDDSYYAEYDPSQENWVDIEGATDSVYHRVVQNGDAYIYFRCKITVEDEEYVTAAKAAIRAEAIAELLEEGEENPEEAVESLVLPEVATVIYSDAGYIDMPMEDYESIPGDLVSNTIAMFATSTPYLSSDKAWLCGLNSQMEYITKDTYDAYGASAANNKYWTSIAGGTRPDGSTYMATALVENSKMEVLSAWYGKTIYVRQKGSSGQGTAISIPAYTGVDYQSGAKTLYKENVKVLSVWIQDTGRSFYKAYVGAISDSNRYLSGSSSRNHITIDDVVAEKFNSNPLQYLQDAEGNYKYDMVIFGGNCYTEVDLSGKAAWALYDYINDGYGFLIGHDTLYGYGGVTSSDYVPDRNSTTTPYYVLNTKTNGHWNMNWLMGVNKRYTEASPYEAASMILDITDYTDKSWLYGDNEGTSTLRIKKVVSGDPLSTVSVRTPTNYPYSNYASGNKITVSSQFTASATHSNEQIAYGTIWIDYASNSVTSLGIGRLLENTNDGLYGTNNFYLTTNGNFGMSQIGHIAENGNVARVDECRILANTILYLSQRMQCQVCQSEQGDNDVVHFVHKISSVEQLEKLKDQTKYWFTYPLDGCYMLTEDIVLPDNWTPIEGFFGHFDADGHTVTLGANGQPLFAQSGTLGQYDTNGLGGWNLGTDSTQGHNKIAADNDNRVTGVARVVGYLSQLFQTSDVDWSGATVIVYGSDGQQYDCVTNLDGKYVISNVPTTGVQKAEVYVNGVAQSSVYGPIRVNVPPAFWDTDETTPLYLLGFSAMPVTDQETYEGQAATMLDGGVYWTSPVTDVQWQVRKGASGDWINIENVAELSGKYSISAPEFHDLDDDSYTSTTLTLTGTATTWSGWYFRAVFRYQDKVADTYSVKQRGQEGKLTVKPWPLKITQAADQEVWVGENASFTTTVDYWAGTAEGLNVDWEFSTSLGSGKWASLSSSGDFLQNGAPTINTTTTTIPVYDGIAEDYGFTNYTAYRTTSTITIKSCDLFSR